MIELLLEILLYAGWWFPVWLGSMTVRVLSLGYARVDDENLAGVIGLFVVLLLIVVPLVWRFAR